MEPARRAIAKVKQLDKSANPSGARRVCGELHQGAAVGSVCGSPQYRQDVIIADVLLQALRRTDLKGHRVGEAPCETMRLEVAQIRCASAGDGTRILDLALRLLCLRNAVCPRARHGCARFHHVAQPPPGSFRHDDESTPTAACVHSKSDHRSMLDSSGIPELI